MLIIGPIISLVFSIICICIIVHYVKKRKRNRLAPGKATYLVSNEYPTYPPNMAYNQHPNSYPYAFQPQMPPNSNDYASSPPPYVPPTQYPSPTSFQSQPQTQPQVNPQDNAFSYQYSGQPSTSSYSQAPPKN